MSSIIPIQTITTNWKPQLYNHLLNNKEMLTIKQFSEFLNIDRYVFRINDLWKWSNNTHKYMLLDNKILNYLGYYGQYNYDKRKVLKILKNNFKEGIDYIIYNVENNAFNNYNSQLIQEKIISGRMPTLQGKYIYINYYCFLELTLIPQTYKFRELIKLYNLRNILFNYYIRYQSDFEYNKIKQ